MPGISIIVPIYNVEKYLNECVDSILAQTFNDIEVILVDDGSPDRCGEMCNAYAAKDNRVRVIHQTNGGLSAARNAGLDAATGEYIQFIDSDDFIDKEMMAKLYKLISDNDADISICNYAKYYEDTGITDPKTTIRGGVVTGEWVIKNTGGDESWVVSVNKLYKKQIFDGLRFSRGRLHEDEFIFHEIFFRCGKVVCTSEAMYYYRIRNNGIMGSPWRINRMDKTDALFNRADAYASRPGYEMIAVKSLYRAIRYYKSFAKEHAADYKDEFRQYERLYKQSTRRTISKLSSRIRKKQRLALIPVYLDFAKGLEKSMELERRFGLRK